MSWQARLINVGLRLIEKPALARAQDPVKLRRDFERKARLLFHPPRGTVFSRVRLGGVPSTTVLPRDTNPDAPVLFYLHGGGYVFGNARTHRALAARIAARSGLRAVLPDYPLAPEAPFPAALDAGLSVYLDLTADVGAHNIIIGGDSAGGGLALSLLGVLLRKGVPLPAGVFGFSPLTDLTFSGASFVENANADVMLPAQRAGAMSDYYLAGQSADDPRASPLFADFAGAPPVWLTVGDTEILRDDSLRMAQRLQDQGVDVTLRVKQNLPHVWPMFHSYMPEANATLDDLGSWLRTRVHGSNGS